LTGLTINFHKSEFFCLGESIERKCLFEEIFTCKSGILPRKYLGVPIDEKRIKSSEWKPAENKIEGKLGCWQGKWLAMGGKVNLINSSLSSIPLYMLSFYRVAKGPKTRMDKHRSRFLWEEEKNKKRYHLVNWDTVCLPKSQGGLGILNLDLMTISLLSKWLWKLFNKDGMWQQILRKKYLSSKTLGQVEVKPGDSILARFDGGKTKFLAVL
jgi:hypothetical protein